MLTTIILIASIIGFGSTITIGTTMISNDIFQNEKSNQKYKVQKMFNKTMNNLLLVLEKEYYKQKIDIDIDTFFDNNKYFKKLNKIINDYYEKIDKASYVVYYAKNVKKLTNLTNEAKEQITKIDNLIKEGKIK